DLNLDGMASYAVNMMTIQGNLLGHLPRLTPLAELPNKAWDGAVLPEGSYTKALMTHNFQEFMQYCAYLGQALMNISGAAQTVADIFSSTDGWSAASLDSVRYAFGDKSVPRPSNLPPWVDGKTWWDKYFEDMRNGAAVPGSPDVWTGHGTHTNPDGGTTSTATNQNGVTKTITTFNIPGGGGTVTTMVMTGPDGREISRTSQQVTSYLSGDSVVTKTTTFDSGGHVTGSKQQVTSYANGEPTSVVTTNYNADGHQTTSSVEGTTADGDQEIRNTSYDADGNPTVTEDINAGPQTDGISGTPDSPTMDAVEDIQHMY
ncbi:MAG TPA: hypothetical protein VFE14_18390, partial [Micromonosporaceae bacterium]|nr:hypothetical protein [Micromonosporaceae bacterium]